MSRNALTPEAASVLLFINPWTQEAVPVHDGIRLCNVTPPGSAGVTTALHLYPSTFSSVFLIGFVTVVVRSRIPVVAVLVFLGKMSLGAQSGQGEEPAAGTDRQRGRL